MSRAGLFWLESDPTTGLNLIQSPTRRLLRRTLGVRSDVNGYGGGALCAAPDTLYAVESSSQQILAIDPSSGKCTAVTADADACFGGLVWDAGQGRLLAVRESSGSQQLVAIERGQPRTLHSGQDFYSAPALSDNGQRIAWVSWQLPNMPWIASTLWVSELADDGGLCNPCSIPTPEPACVQQPVFDGNTLTVLSDHGGWWQPWQWSDSSGWFCLDAIRADGANAPWQLGEHHHLPLPDGGWLRVWFRQGVGELWWQRTAESAPTRLAGEYVDFRCLRRDHEAAYCIARSADLMDSVLSIDLVSGEVSLIAGGEQAFPEVQFSHPEPFSLAVPGADTPAVSGFYYQPVREALSDERPPLILIAHGGPTSMAYAAINPQIQYLCHQGFAVADVNYRGSSGFGRAGRMALGGQWGVLDVQDMERAAEHLIALGKVDPDRVAIQGRSAGGYTALMAMATSEHFAAGVSQFGVSDPERLRALTHRFESGYLDWLLGPYDQHAANWQARSPLAQARRIHRPVAFFQGGKDRVVVPQQTEVMANAIRNNGQTPLVRLYPDEGHGFRQATNQIDMLLQLADFYHRVLR